MDLSLESQIKMTPFLLLFDGTYMHVNCIQSDTNDDNCTHGTTHHAAATHFIDRMSSIVNANDFI